MSMIISTTPATTSPAMSPALEELPPEVWEEDNVVVVVVCVVGAIPVQSVCSSAILTAKEKKTK